MTSILDRRSPVPEQPRLPRIEVCVNDELDISTLPRLRAQLDDALSLRPDQLLIDLSGCRYLDAQAIVVLLEAHRLAYRSGGRLVLRGANAAALRLLYLAGVGEVFSYESADGGHPEGARQGRP